MHIAAGVVLLALSASGGTGLWDLIGWVPLATGALGFCPAYPMRGLSSCPIERAHARS